MSHIKIITPPDKLYTNNLTFLLIYPSKIIKDEFQSMVFDFDDDFDVYLYEVKNKQDHDLNWLLDMCLRCNLVILDIDNSPSIIRDLSSYIIANSNVYWLTNSADNVYNILSNNRIFTLDFLKQKIGAELEQKLSKTSAI